MTVEKDIHHSNIARKLPPPTVADSIATTMFSPVSQGLTTLLPRKSKEVVEARQEQRRVTSFDEDGVHVSVLSDGDASFPNTYSSTSFEDNDDEEEENNNNNNNKSDPYFMTSSYPHPMAYRFDLSESFKNDVMGTYNHSAAAPTTMQVMPPYPMMEETSDSEADSWAQMDGTVGSLEE